MTLFVASLGATALAGLRLRTLAEQIHEHSKVTREVTGGMSDIRVDSAQLAHVLRPDHADQFTLENITTTYALARRQVDIAADGVVNLSDPRSHVLFDSLTETYDQIATLLADASQSGQLDYVAVAPLLDPLTSNSRQLVDKAYAEVRATAAEDAITEQLELLIVLLPFVAVGLLFAVDRVANRDMRQQFNQARRTLSVVSDRRQQTHRITQGQAEVLELVAHGRRLGEVREQIAHIIDAETGGEWELGEHGAVPAVEGAAPLPPALAEMVPGLLEVAAERDRINDALVHDARHDLLTGLANRSAITEATERALQQRHRDHDLAFLFVDLDQFKEVNDNLGHRVGDQVLCEIAGRISAECRSGDLVGRIGGDEFGVLLPDTNSTAAWRIARRIVESASTPIRVEEVEIVVGASIGIALAGPEHRDADLLLNEADQAMYHAKHRHESIVEINNNLREEAERRRDIEQKLKDAIRTEQFEYHFQPIVDTVTERLVGVEALVRLRDGDDLLPPAEFLVVAEETGLIIAIDRLVLAGAAHQVATWNRELGLSLNLAVNMSGVHLNRRDAFDDLEYVMHRSGLAMEDLTIEITEGVFLADYAELATRINRIRHMGVRFAIDDFGTGYSSLAYLQQLPVDILKIDRAFVKRIGSAKGDEAIVKTILDLADALRLETVAEGVERPEQRDRLAAMGCDHCQGYYFGKPAPADKFAQRWFPS